MAKLTTEATFSSRIPLASERLTAAEGAAPRAGEPYTLAALERALHEQSDMTAVERFSSFHDETEHAVQSIHYKALIPLSKPHPGQQYAFHVLLDNCTGCKACVTACHSLNGLDEGETWRSVGLLHGGTPTKPLQQTVTTACHHCVDPACMNGCPVGAYEKHPVTGIVKHLDDQCIGCQYCVLTCPYEVPQFNSRLGIVRKCDMCSDRLAENEAPACVQACPNEAISIRIVDTKHAVEEAQSNVFLPGAPSPGITIPTTTYESKKPLARSMLPADFYSVHAAHTHMPLVIMLVLTQLSVGAFTVAQALTPIMSAEALDALRPWHAVTALMLGLLALGASNLHLGRPMYSFRAFIGLRTSWMSREIVALGAFAGAASLYAAAVWLSKHPGTARDFGDVGILATRIVEPLGYIVAGAGLVGVFCSVMLYHVTRRMWWRVSISSFKFFGTATVLGIATMLVTSTAVSLSYYEGVLAGSASLIRGLAMALVAATLVKLLGEATTFAHLRDRQQGEMKRSALLLIGPLRELTFARYVTGTLGGIVLPLLFLSTATAQTGYVAAFASLLAFLLAIAGELMERTTFFAALSQPRMPGGLP